MFDYEKFDIVEVDGACGIALNSRTLDKAEVEAWCPFFPSESSDYHLYFNRSKELFYCQKRSASGNSVSLYARVYGVSNKEAAMRLSGGDFPGAQCAGSTSRRKQETPGFTVAPLARRHDVYYDLLSELELTNPHRANLMERGLSRERITRGMYRSMPEDLCGETRLCPV